MSIDITKEVIMAAKMGVMYCWIKNSNKKKYDTIPQLKNHPCYSEFTSERQKMGEIAFINSMSIVPFPEHKKKDFQEVADLLLTLPRVYNTKIIQHPKEKESDSEKHRILVQTKFNSTDRYAFRWIILSSIRELLFVYSDAHSNNGARTPLEVLQNYLKNKAKKMQYTPQTATGFVIFCNAYKSMLPIMPADHPSWGGVYGISANIRSAKRHIEILNNPKIGTNTSGFSEVMGLAKIDDDDERDVITFLKEENL